MICGREIEDVVRMMQSSHVHFLLGLIDKIINQMQKVQVVVFNI